MEIILDSSILIQCPDVGFAHILAKNCHSCENFRGFSKATERGEYVPGNEAEDFMVNCQRIVTRRMIKIEDKP